MGVLRDHSLEGIHPSPGHIRLRRAYITPLNLHGVRACTTVWGPWCKDKAACIQKVFRLCPGYDQDRVLIRFYCKAHKGTSVCVALTPKFCLPRSYNRSVRSTQLSKLVPV